MALKITLKPNEKMIVSGAVVTNGNTKNTDLIIENNVPVLRRFCARKIF
jgi:flagellar protein FlbT